MYKTMTRSERIKQLVNRSLYLKSQLPILRLHLDHAIQELDKYRIYQDRIDIDDIDQVSAQIKQLDKQHSNIQKKYYDVERLEYRTRQQIHRIIVLLNLTGTTIEVSDKITIYPVEVHHVAVVINVKD